MADCSYSRCVQERRYIKRELQKWTKNMVYIVGLERVAEELMGRRKWKLYQEVLARSHLNANHSTASSAVAAATTVSNTTNTSTTATATTTSLASGNNHCTPAETSTSESAMPGANCSNGSTTPTPPSTASNNNHNNHSHNQHQHHIPHHLHQHPHSYHDDLLPDHATVAHGPSPSPPLADGDHNNDHVDDDDDHPKSLPSTASAEATAIIATAALASPSNATNNKYTNDFGAAAETDNDRETTPPSPLDTAAARTTTTSTGSSAAADVIKREPADDPSGEKAVYGVQTALTDPNAAENNHHPHPQNSRSDLIKVREDLTNAVNLGAATLNDVAAASPAIAPTTGKNSPAGRRSVAACPAHNGPLDWQPQDKCYFCVDGKLLTVNEHGELVPESGGGSSGGAGGASTMRAIDRDLAGSRSLVDTDSDSSDSSDIAAVRHSLANSSVTSMLQKTLQQQQQQLQQQHQHQQQQPNMMSSFESIAAQFATIASMNSFPQINPGLLYNQFVQMHSNSAEASAAAAAAAILANATNAHLPKTSPSHNNGADPAVSAGGSGEQPLDLSARPSGASGVGGVGLFIDPKQAFRAKPRLSTVAGRRTYTEDELQNALQDILSGKLGTRRAAVLYGIPRSTLRNKVYKLALEQKRESQSLMLPQAVHHHMLVDDDDDDDKMSGDGDDDKELMVMMQRLQQHQQQQQQQHQADDLAAHLPVAGSSAALHQKFASLLANSGDSNHQPHTASDAHSNNATPASCPATATSSTPPTTAATTPLSNNSTVGNHNNSVAPNNTANAAAAAAAAANAAVNALGTNPWFDPGVLQSLLLAGGLLRPDDASSVQELMRTIMFQQELMKEQRRSGNAGANVVPNAAASPVANHNHVATTAVTPGDQQQHQPLNNGKASASETRHLLHKHQTHADGLQQQHHHPHNANQSQLHGRLSIKAETPDTVSSVDLSGIDAADDAAGVILKIPSFKPVAGSSSSGKNGSGGGGGFIDSLSDTTPQTTPPMLSCSPMTHLSSAGVSPPMMMRSTSADSPSPPLQGGLGGNSMLSLRDVIAKSITRTFNQQQHQQQNSPEPPHLMGGHQHHQHQGHQQQQHQQQHHHANALEHLSSSGEHQQHSHHHPNHHHHNQQQQAYKRPSISVIKNLGGTDISRFATSPNMMLMGANSGGGGGGGSAASNAAALSAAAAAKGTRPKRGKYRNYDRDSLVEAVKAVQRGEMSVHRAGSYYGVPHSTLEYKVKERHLMRPRKREPKPQPMDTGSSPAGSSQVKHESAAGMGSPLGGGGRDKSLGNAKGAQQSTKSPLKTPPAFGLDAPLVASAPSSASSASSSGSSAAATGTSTAAAAAAAVAAAAANGLKLNMFDAAAAAASQLPYPSHIFWSQPPGFPPGMPIDFGRAAAAAAAAAAATRTTSGGGANSGPAGSASFPGESFFTNQMMHRFQEDALRQVAAAAATAATSPNHRATPSNSSSSSTGGNATASAPGSTAQTSVAPKSTRDIAESLYDGTSANGSFLDGIIRHSLDRKSGDIPHGALLEHLVKSGNHHHHHRNHAEASADSALHSMGRSPAGHKRAASPPTLAYHQQRNAMHPAVPIKRERSSRSSSLDDSDADGGGGGGGGGGGMHQQQRIADANSGLSRGSSEKLNGDSPEHHQHQHQQQQQQQHNQHNQHHHQQQQQQHHLHGRPTVRVMATADEDSS